MTTTKTDICLELEALQKEIKSLPDQVPIDSIKSPHISNQRRLSTSASTHAPTPSLSAPKPRFARLQSSFRRLSSKSTQKSPDIPLLEDLSPPASPSSPVSTGSQTKVVEDTATLLLALLAPLISRLQRLGSQLREREGVEIQKGMVVEFISCCTALGEKVEGYKRSKTDHGADPHDLEMKTLLLDALRKKIESEQESLNKAVLTAQQQVINTTPVMGVYTCTTTDLQTDPTRADKDFQTNGIDENPLILHSTGVLSTTRRSITPSSQPVGIGIGIGGGNHMGVYPSFANAGQQTGLSNVFRLGSFQNSLLFSPSPVAIRRPAVAEPLKV